MSLRIGVDVGGTFTDLVACDDATRRLFEHKVLTTPDKSGDGGAARTP